MEIGEKVRTYVNYVHQIAYTLQFMEMTVDDKEIAMAVLNGIPPQFKNLILALDASRNAEKCFTLYYAKSWLLQKERRSEMQEEKPAKNGEVFVVLIDNEKVCLGVSAGFRRTKFSLK